MFFLQDSPKLRNKNLAGAQRNVRNSMYETSRKPVVVPKRPVPAHNIVVVRAAVTKEVGTDRDPDIQRMQVSTNITLKRIIGIN